MPTSYDTLANREAVERVILELADYVIPPSRLKYDQGPPLGRGGFGKVVKATLLEGPFFRTKRSTVAIKTLLPKVQDTVRLALRFTREVALWCKLDHPNVLKLLGFYLNQKTLEEAFLVSPYLQNGSVRQYLLQAEPQIGQRHQWIHGVTEGLQYLHSFQPPIIHGDLKADNILLDDSLQPLLCDFGLSMVADENQHFGLTTSDGFKGSMRWCSPEIFNGQQRSLPSDIWAWALVILEIMTNRIPYQGCKTDGDLMKRLTDNGKRPSESDYPPFPLDHLLWPFLTRCFDNDPARRPDSFDCVLEMESSLPLDISDYVDVEFERDDSPTWGRRTAGKEQKVTPKTRGGRPGGAPEFSFIPSPSPPTSAHRFAMHSMPNELDLRSLLPNQQELSPYQSNPPLAVNEEPPQSFPTTKSLLRSPSGPFPFPSVARHRKTSSASHNQYQRTWVASPASTSSGAGGPAMSLVPPRSALRRPAAKSSASFTGLLEGFGLAPNSPSPMSAPPIYSTIPDGRPNPNYPGVPYPSFSERPLPQRPSDASQISFFDETFVNPHPSLTPFAPTLPPETAGSSAYDLQSDSTLVEPKASKRKHALFELLSSERAYVADLALVRDIHMPLSRGLPSALDPPPPPITVNGAGIYDNHKREASPRSPSASTHSSVSTAPTSVVPLDPPLPQEASKVIFSNIDDIATFSDEFCDRLDAALGDMVPGGVGEDRVGQLFVDTIPLLTPLYKIYITRYPTALAQYQSLTPSPALTQYLSRANDLCTAHMTSWDIPSLLIKPIQRLPNYSLLLGTIYDETPNDHPDKLKLLEAKEMLEEMTRMVTEGRRRWEVVKGILGQGKTGSTANSAKDTSAVKPARPKVTRMRSFRSRVKVGSTDNAQLDAEEIEQWEKRMKECEVVVKEVAKQTLEWNRELDKALLPLKNWNASFGRVVGLGETGTEAVGAFGKVVTGIQRLCSDFHKIIQTLYLPKLSMLLRTLTSPKTLLAHMHVLRHSHLTLLNNPGNKVRPPSALVEASNDYLALQATLREELPQYFAIFEKGLAVILLEFSGWQKNLWREVKHRWMAFWIALAADEEQEGYVVGIGSGAEETVKIWQERFEEVEAVLNACQITKIYTKPPKLTPSRQTSAFRYGNHSSEVVETSQFYQQSKRSMPTYNTLHNPPIQELPPSSTWEEIQQQINQRSSASTPSLYSRHKRGNSAVKPAPGLGSVVPQLVQSSNAIYTPPGWLPPIAPPANKGTGKGSRMQDASPREQNMPYPTLPYAKSLPVPRLIEPFAQGVGVGRAFAPSLPSGQGSPPSARDKKRGKERDRESKEVNDTDLIRSTSPRPFRRIADNLFGMPRLGHGRSESAGSQKDFNTQSVASTQKSIKKETSTDTLTDIQAEFPPLPPVHAEINSFAEATLLPFSFDTPPEPIYTCTTVFPFRHADEWYMHLPLLNLKIGDIIQVLQEAGHPKNHALPIPIEEDDDCLLLASDEHDNVGWVLASYVVPLVQ